MKRTTLIALSCLCMATTLTAVPAYNGPIKITLADNKEATVYQHGDETFHYLTTEDGTWVRLTADKRLEKVAPLSSEEIALRRQQAAKRPVTHKATPTNIAPRGLVILVNFNDLTFRPENTKEAMNAMFNEPNYTYENATGSVRDYFFAQSFGQYDPQFDVVGPVTLSNGMAYYGKNNRSGSEMNTRYFVQEACELAHEAGADFSQYDNDNDGVVDFVFIYYAGYNEAESSNEDEIWPHYSNLDNWVSLTLDGKKISAYACSSELSFSSKDRAGISTFCHEFGHVLGLPDLYCTDYSSNHKTLGAWDIMDHGSYNNDGRTPPAYSAYERFFLGWLTPTVLNKPATITMSNINDTRQACIITSTGEHNLIGNDPTPNEFYILENRQRRGYDTFLPWHGLMITKINYSYSIWYRNTPNDDPNNQRVDLIEANGKAPERSNGKKSDLFPQGSTFFTPYTGYEITNIKEIAVDGKDSLIVFDFMGGGDSIGLATDNIADDEERVVAIYNMLGQPQGTTQITALPVGYYVVCTNKQTRKVVVR